MCSGIRKIVHDSSTTVQKNASSIEDILRNSRAVEVFARQMQVRVNEEWNRVPFIEQVVVPTFPSSPCELEQTRKSLDSRSLLDLNSDFEIRSKTRGCCGVHEDFDCAVSFPIENDDVSPVGIQIMNGAEIFAHKSERKSVSRAAFLNAAKCAVSLFNKENSRLEARFHKALLGQMQDNEGLMYKNAKDLLLQGKSLAQGVFEKQRRILQECERKLENLLHLDSLNSETDKEPGTNLNFRNESDARQFDLQRQWDELLLIINQLPINFQNISEYLADFVNDVLQDASDAAVLLDEGSLIQPYAIESNNFDDKTHKDDSLSPSDSQLASKSSNVELVLFPEPAASAKVESDIGFIVQVIELFGDLVSRIELITKNAERNSRFSEYVQEPSESEQNPSVIDAVVNLRKDVVTAVSSMDRRIASMGERLDSLQEVHIELCNGQAEMQAKLKEFLDLELPALLEKQTAYIRQQLMNHLEPMARRTAEVGGAIMPDTLKSPRDCRSTTMQELEEDCDENVKCTMSFVGCIVQQTVGEVVKSIDSILSHGINAEVRSDIGKDEQETYQDQATKKINTEFKSADSSKATNTSNLQSLSNASKNNYGATCEGKGPNRLSGSSSDLIFGEILPELIDNGALLVDLLDESIFLSLLDSLSQDGPIALVLRKYISYVKRYDSILACGDDLSIERESCEKDDTSHKDVRLSQRLGAWPRAMSGKSREAMSILERDGRYLLDHLGKDYIQSLISTLCEWSGRNFLASAFCMKLGSDLSLKEPNTQHSLSAGNVDDFVQLGNDARSHIHELGTEYLESVSSPPDTKNREPRLLSLPIPTSSPDIQSQNDLPKTVLMSFLSARSVEKLEFLISQTRYLLAMIKNDGCDVLELLRTSSRDNIVAAAIYHQMMFKGESCLVDQSPADVAPRTLMLLERLLEQGADLLVLLKKNDSSDILSQVLHTSSLQSPLAAILYSELCKISQSGPRDPVALRRMLSAKTKRNLDLVIAESRSLLLRLGDSHIMEVLSDLGKNERESPLGSILLQEILNETVQTSKECVSARLKVSVEQILDEGKKLVMNINNEYADALFETLIKNTERSPISKILCYEIMSHKNILNPRGAKRTLSARSKKYLQDLLCEGQMLLSALSQQSSAALLSSVCESVHQNVLASIIYTEIISYWFRSENKSLQDISLAARDLNFQAQHMLCELVQEGRTLLNQLDPKHSSDILSSLFSSRERSPLNAVLLHKILQLTHNIPQFAQKHELVNEEGRKILEDLLVEGQGLLESIGKNHAESILTTIGSKVKSNPLSVLIYNRVLASFISDYSYESVSDAVRFNDAFFCFLDAQFSKELAELLKEGQDLFELLGDVYAKSLLGTVVLSAGENPMAALLYSDNLLSIKDSLDTAQNQQAILPETIKAVLSARSLKNYGDVLLEGEDLLEKLDPILASYIVDAISGQETLLSCGLVHEIMQFVPDDNSQSEPSTHSNLKNMSPADCDEKCESDHGSTDAVAFEVCLSQDTAKDVLNRAACMHFARKAWRLRKESVFASRLQCAFRSFCARRQFQFWKKISEFVKFSASHLNTTIYDQMRKRQKNSRDVNASESKGADLRGPVFKFKHRKPYECFCPNEKKCISSSAHSSKEKKDRLSSARCCHSKALIKWERQSRKVSKQIRFHSELLLAQTESGLKFSNLSLINCIIRMRSTESARSKKGKINATPISLCSKQQQQQSANEYRYAVRRGRNAAKTVQNAYRNFRARNVFANVFIHRENIRNAALKIVKWIARCRALKILRGTAKLLMQKKLESQCATCIQQTYRIHLAKLDVSYFKRFTTLRKCKTSCSVSTPSKAASSLQKCWRGHEDRKKVFKLFSVQTTAAKDQLAARSVVTIQSAVRNHLARHTFVSLNERFCTVFFASVASNIQRNFRSHVARKKASILRKSLNLMQQYAAKLAWLRTIEDLVKVSAVEWHKTCQRASSIVSDQTLTFSFAQTLAPAVFPTWWLSHFPVSLSCRVDLHSETFLSLERQIRIDRTNSLGGASSFAKSLNMIEELVNELTESHSVALGMSESYNVLVSLMAFCNIHGAKLITSIDKASQKAGSDLLLFSLRLADGPFLSLPGLSERAEYLRWTQSNICRMYYLLSNFEKVIQYARLLMSTPRLTKSDSLIFVIGNMYLAAAQSKLGRHVTAATTLQTALGVLEIWNVPEDEVLWTTFSCSKEPDRFYQCSSAHFASVCFYNLAVEFVASEQCSDALTAIQKAYVLAQQELVKEPIFLRRVRLTKIAIQTICCMNNICTPPFELPERIQVVRQTSMAADASTCIGPGPARSSGHDNVTEGYTKRHSNSKQRFGAWFPPSIAFRNHVSVPIIRQRDFNDDFDANHTCPRSMFLKLKSPPIFENAYRNTSPRRLSPLRRIKSETNKKQLIILFAVPVESNGVFELVCNESEILQRTALRNQQVNQSLDCLKLLRSEYRVLHSRSDDGKENYSEYTLLRMMDLVVLCVQLIFRDIADEYRVNDFVSEHTLKSTCQVLNIALNLLFGPLGKDTSQKACDVRALALYCRSVFFMLKNEIQKALWVLSDAINGSKVRLSQRQLVVFLLNSGLCLSLLGRHKESFDLSYSAWKVIQSAIPSESWFCFSPSYHFTEVTRHRWNVFASFCKLRLANESFLLGFEGPCLRFAEESSKFLEIGMPVHSRPDRFLSEAVLAQIEEASSFRTIPTQMDARASLDTKLMTLKGLRPHFMPDNPVRYAWPSPGKNLLRDLDLNPLPRLPLSRASEPLYFN